VFTRLLTPEQFGYYNLSFTAVLIVQACVFNALSSSVVRLLPGAQKDGTGDPLLKAAFVILGSLALAVVLVASAILASGLVHPALMPTAVLAVPLLVTRAIAGINQAVNRIEKRPGRFSLVEVCQSVVALAAGYALVVTFEPTGTSVMLGMLVGSTVSITLNAGNIRRAFASPSIDRPAAREILRFAAPLMLALGAAVALQYADRFIVAHYGDIASVAIYAVAFALIDRPLGLVCTAINTTMFPTAVRLLEQKGAEAAQRQLATTATVLLALLVPACAGLVLASVPLVHVLVGEAYRDGVTALMPVMSLGLLLRAFTTHFLNHALHLAKRSDLMLWINVAALVVNIGADLVVVPRHGVMGAAVVATASFGAVAIATWLIGRRVFSYALPFLEIGRIVAATACMAGAILALDFERSVTGLVLLILCGVSVYGLAGLALNVGGSRDRVRARLRR
ncbi:MAG TPA: oligosaccharide flippase family protein, partial [Nevskiaceae bacterium]|nr:oligosaccharide flippase family protein [Nevskiaceae bacterium]